MWCGTSCSSTIADCDPITSNRMHPPKRKDPAAALLASVARHPTALAALAPGKTVLDSVRVAASTCCCRAAGCQPARPMVWT